MPRHPSEILRHSNVNNVTMTEAVDDENEVPAPISHERARLSLPPPGNSPANTPSVARLGSDQRHSIPRVLPAKRLRDEDRPGVVMFDRLFSITPLPLMHGHSEGIQQSEGARKRSDTPSLENSNAVNEKHAHSTFTEENDIKDEIDEISILGVDMPLAISGSEPRYETPVRYLDDSSIKLESPAVLSTGKLLEDNERQNRPHTTRSSPRQSMRKGMAAPEAPHTPFFGLREKSIDLEQATVLLPSNSPDAVLSESATNLVVQPREMNEITRPVQVPPAPSSIDIQPELLRTPPRRQHRFLPYADDDVINTPARPVEELQYLLDLPVATPPRRRSETSNKKLIPRSNHAHTRGESPGNSPPCIKSTKGCIRDLNPITTDYRASSSELPGKIRDSISTVNTSTPASVVRTRSESISTPRAGQQLIRVLNLEETHQKKLGSAIRLGQNSDKSPKSISEVRGLQRPLILPTVAFDISTPQNRASAMPSATDSFVGGPRPETPPTKKRRTMDIPLSRSNPSIELWENPSPVIRLPSSRSPSPDLEVDVLALESAKTPPMKLRKTMDIPIRDDDATTEMWREGEAQPRRPRRTLLSPSPRAYRKSTKFTQMLVAESPQALESVEVFTPPPQIRFNGKPFPRISKLDFGAALRRAKSIQSLESISQVGEAYEKPDVLRQSYQYSTEMSDVVPASMSTGSPDSPRRSTSRELAGSPGFGQHIANNHVEADGCSGSLEEETPRTMRRKQLSDDISLDFDQSPAPHGAIHVCAPYLDSPMSIVAEFDDATAPAPPFQAEASLSDEERSQTPKPIATPILTLTRKTRVASTPTVSHKKKEHKSQQRRASSTSRSRRESASLLESLTVFGVVPPVLPRATRERKRPAEYWKAPDRTPVKNESAEVTQVAKRKHFETLREATSKKLKSVQKQKSTSPDTSRSDLETSGSRSASNEHFRQLARTYDFEISD